MVAHCPNTLSAFCCGIYSCFQFSFDNMMIFIFSFTIKEEGLLGEFNAWLAELLRREVYGTEVYRLLSHCWIVLLLQMLWPSVPKTGISCLREESQPYRRNHTEFPTPSGSEMRTGLNTHGQGSMRFTTLETRGATGRRAITVSNSCAPSSPNLIK